MAKGTRGGKRVYIRKDGTWKGMDQIPEGMPHASYERRKADGYTDAEIAKIWDDTLAMRKVMQENIDRREREGDREITSGTYERAQKRLNKEVSNWFGNRR